MVQLYGINNDDQIMSSNLLSIENLIEHKVRNNLYQEATLHYRDMPTAQIFKEHLEGLSQFLEIRYTKLNKEYRQEIISIFKLRTQSHNFQQVLHMRHYSMKSQLCMCGRGDTFKNIFECVYHSDMLRKFSYQFPGKDMQRLITYYQIYLNQQFTSIQQSEIDFRIKNFHRNLLKKRVEMLGKNTNNKLKTKRQQQDSLRRSKEELEDEKNDARIF